MEMDTDVEKAANLKIKTNADPPKLSFKAKIAAAQDEHKENNTKLCFAMCGLCLGTIGCQIISILFTLIPIGMIYLGITNFHNCPINSNIPLYLLVQGICTILDQVLIFCQCRNKKEESATDKTPLWGRLFDMFVFIWFIAGSVFVYKIYKPNYDASLGDYCDKTTYLFAFWSITLVYGLIGFLIFLCCCIFVVICLTK